MSGYPPRHLGTFELLPPEGYNVDLLASAETLVGLARGTLEMYDEGCQEEHWHVQGLRRRLAAWKEPPLCAADARYDNAVKELVEAALALHARCRGDLGAAPMPEGGEG